MAGVICHNRPYLSVNQPHCSGPQGSPLSFSLVRAPPDAFLNIDASCRDTQARMFDLEDYHQVSIWTPALKPR